MAFTSATPVVVGNPTKADDYDKAFNNTKANRDLIRGDNAESSGETGHGHTGTGLNDGVLIATAAIADNAVTEAKIADTDLPEAARAYLTTEVNGVSTAWAESYDPGGNMSTVDAGGGNIVAQYTVPTDGLYYINMQAKHDVLSGLIISAGGIYSIESQGVTSTSLGASVTATLKLSAADTITFAYSQPGGGNFTVGSDYTFMEVFKLPFTTAY